LAEWEQFGKRRNKEEERKREKKWKKSLDTNRPSHGRHWVTIDPVVEA
jgi:hypothetical protein